MYADDGQPLYQIDLPHGSYLTTCDPYTCVHNKRYLYHTLDCRCKNDNGVYQNTFLKYLDSECMDISNVNGDLTCWGVRPQTMLEK